MVKQGRAPWQFESLEGACLQLFGGAADARTSLTRLAGDVTSWWANFDPSPQSAALPGTTATDGSLRQPSLASQVLSAFLPIDCLFQRLKQHCAALQLSISAMLDCSGLEICICLQRSNLHAFTGHNATRMQCSVSRRCACWSSAELSHCACGSGKHGGAAAFWPARDGGASRAAVMQPSPSSPVQPQHLHATLAGGHHSISATSQPDAFTCRLGQCTPQLLSIKVCIRSCLLELLPQGV